MGNIVDRFYWDAMGNRWVAAVGRFYWDATGNRWVAAVDRFYWDAMREIYRQMAVWIRVAGDYKQGCDFCIWLK